MRIVAFDISIRNLGVAITEDLNYIFSTNIKTLKVKKNRLLYIYEKSEEIVREFQPKIAVIEDVIYHKNIKTVILLGSVKGIIQLLLEKNDIGIVEINPKSLKLSISGYGASKKHQIQYMVKNVFKIEKELSDHESDALALIWTYISKYGLGTKR
ncbi:MAG: crossover junction endodeoxyribonuclease RuvC [candidate division WOR-3 bacterium]|nr:crossover junction endodeoxyribonuclease RuvC [candidate division WOR-3 bacterium]MCX7947439.1 crossover junction endodeoxyribonuclease RuvC [candidate division WOR-3 bacterium]MDW8150599.1 crossover junction endodeoxyribonuclease RuvC [candidate division WOR-3 bacterium]